MTLQLAIVLPTLNERANLRALVERLDAALGDVAWEADRKSTRLNSSHG